MIAIETLEDRLAQHAPYVWQQAHRAASAWGVPAADLAQEGFIGLCIAHERYIAGSPDATFLTYAAWWVRNRINRYVVNTHSLIRPPAGRFASGRAPTIPCDSIQAKAEEDPFFEVPDPSAAPAHESLDAEFLHHHLQALKPRQRQILELSFLQSVPDKQIARILGISHQAISHQRKRALKKLRQKITEAESFSRFR